MLALRSGTHFGVFLFTVDSSSLSNVLTCFEYGSSIPNRSSVFPDDRRDYPYDDRGDMTMFDPVYHDDVATDNEDDDSMAVFRPQSADPLYPTSMFLEPYI